MTKCVPRDRGTQCGNGEGSRAEKAQKGEICYGLQYLQFWVIGKVCSGGQ